MDGDFIIKVLRVLCPYLKKVADKYGNPYGIAFVNILCRLIDADAQVNGS